MCVHLLDPVINKHVHSSIVGIVILWYILSILHVQFKGSSSSLLFGVGLFNSDLSTPVSQSAILAPDSEEEEEEDCN